MLIKINSPINTATSRGTLFGQPIDVAVARMKACAEDLRRAVEKVPGRGDTFGSQIAQAVRRKTSAHLPTQKQHADRVERESKRYVFKTRPRTKGD